MTLPFTKSGELCIAKCMMLGCRFDYNDFGHPERATARKYHTCSFFTVAGGFSVSCTGYGYDQADAAYDYLRRYHPELL
jgi:hypothetical protein